MILRLLKFDSTICKYKLQGKNGRRSKKKPPDNMPEGFILKLLTNRNYLALSAAKVFVSRVVE